MPSSYNSLLSFNVVITSSVAPKKGFPMKILHNTSLTLILVMLAMNSLGAMKRKPEQDLPNPVKRAKITQEDRKITLVCSDGEIKGVSESLLIHATTLFDIKNQLGTKIDQITL